MKVTWESDLCFKRTIWLSGLEGEGGNWLHPQVWVRGGGVDSDQSMELSEVDGFERGSKRLRRACTLLSWLADCFR